MQTASKPCRPEQIEADSDKVLTASTGNDRPTTYIEAIGLVECSSQICHCSARTLRHDLRPDETAHPSEIGAHGVFSLLLANDTFRSCLVRAQQPLVFDLAIELTKMALLVPIEVGDSKQRTAMIDDAVLKFWHRDAEPMELDSRNRLAR